MRKASIWMISWMKETCATVFAQLISPTLGTVARLRMKLASLVFSAHDSGLGPLWFIDVYRGEKYGYCEFAGACDERLWSG